MFLRSCAARLRKANAHDPLQWDRKRLSSSAGLDSGTAPWWPLHAMKPLPILALALLGQPALAAERPAFTQKPTAARSGAGVTIEFTVDRHTDVAVTVEDAGGRIVRHLAAGVLGTNPPEPLRPNSLRQSLTWD